MEFTILTYLKLLDGLFFRLAAARRDKDVSWFSEVQR